MGRGLAMEHASAGIERIAEAILEMRQRTEALLAENSRLRAELAALRQGVGIMVVIEGRLYQLGSGWVAPNDPLYPQR
jgi:regulator of replication initiation timing